MTKNILFITILFSIVFGQDKKILFIGLDGCRSDALNVADTPNIDSFIENGLIIENALSSVENEYT